MRIARLGVAGFVALSLAVDASAQTTIDFSLFHGEQDGFAAAWKHWAEKVKEKTQGRVQFKPHWSGSLINITQALTGTRDGVVPGATTSFAHSSGAIPSLAFAEVIGGFPAGKDAIIEAAGRLQGPAEMLFKAHKVDYIWTQPAFGGLVMCRDKHLKVPADWKGRKVRTAGRWQSLQVQALGASAVTIDPGEQYIALKQGTVDCVLSNNTLARGLKLHEVGPKITQFGLAINAVVYILGTGTMEKMSEADRKAVREAGAEAMRFSVDYLLSQQQQAADDMRKGGADIYALNDGERKQLMTAVKPVFEKIAETAGEAGKSMRAALEKFW